jgi:hypothetical protein
MSGGLSFQVEEVVGASDDLSGNTNNSVALVVSSELLVNLSSVSVNEGSVFGGDFNLGGGGSRQHLKISCIITVRLSL